MKPTRKYHSLNGAWRLVLDPEDRGLAEQWFASDHLPDGLDVTVPSVWDRWVPDYDGVGWYFFEFEAEVPGGTVAELRFEAADYYAEVWLNGQRLGEHEGGYTPFCFDATQVLRASKNMLAVRIVDPHSENGYGPFHPKQIPSAKERGYYSFAGIWGQVELIEKPKTSIRDVFVQPDIRRKRLTATVDAPEACQVRVSIEGTGHVAEGTPGELLIEFPDHEPWSPESPVLYTLWCELIEGEQVIDALPVRFGMREFTVKENRFFLNNRPIFIRGVLHQPDYPLTLAAPSCEEQARRELELAKEAGFNLIRLHIKTAPEITLRLCDELGLLVYAEPPIGWIQKSKHMKERCEREVREMILRDRNHPSVVIWGMLNESGNCHYVVNGGAQLIKDDLCRLARSLDPSRLIIDDSGGVNATREPARFMRPYRDELEVYDDLHIYQRGPVDHEIENYLRYSGEPGQLFFLSEFGFGGLEDLPAVLEQYGESKDIAKDAAFVREAIAHATKGFTERGLERVFTDFSAFAGAAQAIQAEAAVRQADAIRLNSKAAGYCLTQLCDAGHEICAGILDRWRRPKAALAALKEVQQPVRPIIQLAQTNLTLRQEVDVSVTLINETRLEGRADLSLQVVGPTDQVLWKKKRNVKIPRHGKELWEGHIAASGSPGTHRFVVRLMQGIKVLAEASLPFQVFEAASPCDVPTLITDPDDRYTAACASLAKLDDIHPMVYVVPPLANSIRAYPSEQLARVLAEVYEGAVAIIFGPPDDWNDLANALNPALQATSKDAVGAALAMFHYVKLHPVFEGLPTRCLMGQPYVNVIPAKAFIETSEEDICGTFDTMPASAGHYMIEDAPWWASDILVRRYGSGRVVFTHLRVMEHVGKDPAADHLFVNMLRHFSRRSVPSETGQDANLQARNWLNQQRKLDVRRWMVLGMFPNWGGEGHNTAYPPEDGIDFTATYPGWCKAIEWKPWYSRQTAGHLVDLQEAFTPVYEYYPRFDCGTGYAYGEFTCPGRIAATLKLGVQDATKVWLNDRLVFEDPQHRPLDTLEEQVVPVMFKQGRNTVLVKVSKIPGQFRFSLDFDSKDSNPLPIAWWR